MGNPIVQIENRIRTWGFLRAIRNGFISAFALSLPMFAMRDMKFDLAIAFFGFLHAWFCLSILMAIIPGIGALRWDLYFMKEATVQQRLVSRIATPFFAFYVAAATSTILFLLMFVEGVNK